MRCLTVFSFKGLNSFVIMKLTIVMIVAGFAAVAIYEYYPFAAFTLGMLVIVMAGYREKPRP